jgi:phage shock protein C
MSTRTRQQVADPERRLDDRSELSVELESMSDDELEELLFTEEEPRNKGFVNLPTMSGLAMILVGIVYLLQEFGLWAGPSVDFFVSTLPWLAGILIILIGFGVMSWRPGRKRRKVKKGVEVRTGERVRVETETVSGKKRGKLVRSRNKQIAGVCAGIAEYFNIDPTLVRIAFVVGTIVTSGAPFIIAYFILAWVMPKPETFAAEERITILRDS